MDQNWKNNNWKTASKQNVKNVDLWKELDNLSSNFVIKWTWVKGHSDVAYNNEVDELARNAAESN